jgi:hypothetical protein
MPHSAIFNAGSEKKVNISGCENSKNLEQKIPVDPYRYTCGFTAPDPAQGRHVRGCEEARHAGNQEFDAQIPG